jgi:hypothetical protein
MEEAAEPIASVNAEVVAGRRDLSSAVGWFLANGPTRLGLS